MTPRWSKSADLDDLDDEEHPDYYHIDPDQLDNNPPGEVKSRKVFKAIALPSKDAQVFDLIITATAGANFLLKHGILRQDHSKPHSVAEKIDFHFFAAFNIFGQNHSTKYHPVVDNLQ